MIVNHNHPQYQAQLAKIGNGKYNGAYYYSKEICEYIIPKVHTDRNWITVNIKGVGCGHSIVFIHNNMHPEHYDWLSRYDDLVLVCGVPETCQKVKHLGKAIYLPLSVNVSEVERYRTQKTRDTAFVGRRQKRLGVPFPTGTDFIEGLPRDQLLSKIARYRKVFAVGRTAIECKILGCEILPYDERFPDTSVWEIVDSSEAAKMLQVQLDVIDRGIL